MKKIILLFILSLIFTLTGCVDDMFKDVHNLIYDEGMYSSYIGYQVQDDTKISYIEVEIIEVSEYEASQFNNSFKQEFKYITGENENRFLKANMLVIYSDGEEEIINLNFKDYMDQYDILVFDVDFNDNYSKVKIIFTYNNQMATSKYKGKYSNGMDVQFQHITGEYRYRLSDFETYHTHRIHKGDYIKKLIELEQSTCLIRGYQKVKCDECDYEIVEQLPLLTHKYEDGKCIWCHSEKYPAHYFYIGHDEDREETTKFITSNKELQQCFLDNDFIYLSKEDIMNTYNDTYFENKSLVYISYWTNSSVYYNVTKTEIKYGKVDVYLDIVSPYSQHEDYILMNILVEVEYKADENTELNLIRKIIRLKEYQTFS